MPSLKELAPHIRNIYEAISEATSGFLLTVLEKDGRQIYLVGTKHTRSPGDQQVTDLETAFRRCLEEPKREIVLCLEGKVFSSGKTVEEAVSQAGEQAVLINIATKEKIEFLSIEPTFEKINLLAIEIFHDRKALAGWALLNFLSGVAKDGKIGLEKKELLIKVLDSIGSQYKIAEDYLSTFGVLRDYLEENSVIDFFGFDQLFENSFDRERAIEAQKPTNGPYVTNRAAVCMNLARDFGLMENALHVFEKTHKNLFVWQGLNHVISQLPAYLHLGFREIK